MGQECEVWVWCEGDVSEWDRSVRCVYDVKVMWIGVRSEVWCGVV